MKKSVEHLLKEYERSQQKKVVSRLCFTGIENDQDVYNITAPFEINGTTYIAGRVEPRFCEISKVCLFQKKGDVWNKCLDFAPLDLQDPFVTKIDQFLILGGVEVFRGEKGTWDYRTVFFRGRSVNKMERFAQGPDHMKDIRLCQLDNGKILVMTRPQGAIGGRGKIGYLIIDSLQELNSERITGAVLLEDQFFQEEWGGCNELHLLKNGKIGVLSHIACFGENGYRHYYATVFCFDYRTGEHTDMKIIATREDFQDGASKREDLKDVIFSGGLLRKGDKTEFYCGASDAEGHMMIINDPFLEYEV